MGTRRRKGRLQIYKYMKTFKYIYYFGGSGNGFMGLYVETHKIVHLYMCSYFNYTSIKLWVCVCVCV